MNKIAFCSVAVKSKNYGDAYIQQQERLKQSILSVYPDASTLFWTDIYPQGSRDWLTSSYGFKPHAVNAAVQLGYTKIVYFDAAMILLSPIEIDHIINQFGGVIAAKDDSNLANVTSNKALEFFGVERKELDGKNLVGGSFYYFDFEYEQCNRIFGLWKEAEEAGIFGSQEEESAGLLQGHRHDEACMAICLYENDSKPCDHDLIGYNSTVMTKKHFR